eukprot:6518526-Prymnesium_polylepis.1
MIPGMHVMARKLQLARALNRLRRLFAEEFAFYPQTWSLPLELEEFKAHCAHVQTKADHQPPTYIVKPSAGCQGAGIYLVRWPQQLHGSQRAAAVVQEYVASPLLLDGLKFDLRCYVLVKSVQPLVAYLYREGMARFATAPYAPPDESNLSN